MNEEGNGLLWNHLRELMEVGGRLEAQTRRLGPNDADLQAAQRDYQRLLDDALARLQRWRQAQVPRAGRSVH